MHSNLSQDVKAPQKMGQAIKYEYFRQDDTGTGKSTKREGTADGWSCISSFRLVTQKIPELATF